MFQMLFFRYSKTPILTHTMNIWIDVVNSPHVLFFRPIVEELNRRGHSASITAREYAQTTGLLDRFRIQYTLIGAHAGAKITKKIIDVFKRGAQLRTYAKDKSFDLAITFNSPSLALAAKMLRIPSIIFMDYEYQPLNHLTFRLCDKVVTPTFFPDKALSRFGALNKTIKFDGLKEQVYLSDFRPEQGFLHSLDIDENKIIVTTRPPATMALYHRFEHDFFYEVVKHLLRNKDVIVIAVPRSEEQRETLQSLELPNLIIPEKALDGRNLLFYSDIVVSAGGTMNREAAVLGTPAYTVFKGRIGAVDQYLIDQGRITPIHSYDGVAKVRIEKKDRRSVLADKTLTSHITDLILHSN